MPYETVPNTAPNTPPVESFTQFSVKQERPINGVAVSRAEQADISHPWALLHGYDFGEDIDDSQELQPGTPGFPFSP
jgi:hypothetical protein